MYRSYNKIRRFSATGELAVKMHRYRTAANLRNARKAENARYRTVAAFALYRRKSAVEGFSADYNAFYAVVGIEGYYIALFADLY